MQKSARQFLDLLESQQLLAPDILGELRRQADESKSRLTSEVIARLLVDNGHLTKFQATKLIAELKSTSPSKPTADDARLRDDDLGFAEDKPAARSGAGESGESAATARVFMDDDEPSVPLVQPVDVVPVDVVPVEVVPIEVVPGDAVPVDVVAVEVPAVEVPAVEATPLKPIRIKKSRAGRDGANAESGKSPGAPLATSAPQRLQRPSTATKPAANPYDSFRILGVALLLALVLVAGFFLVNHFWRGNAEQRLQAADEAYEQRSYETAQTSYREFAEVFPSNEKASYAKVRSALAAIRNNAEGAPDPKLGLDTALQVLPALIGEPSLNDQQSDLAGVLIALAVKFNERADRTQEMEQRKQLMSEMDQLLELINDPQFVGTNQRNQQAPTLNRIHENRQRILREINRDEELAKALADIDAKLATQDTLGAYDVRRALIGRYPLLEADQGLTERVRQASALQRTLVKPSGLDVEPGSAPPATGVGRSFILANQTGPAAAALSGIVLFVKAHGSVYGIDGESGQILWRHFVGRHLPSQPLRIGADESDAIVCQPEPGIISRLTGRSGSPMWSTNLGTPVHTPSLVDEDMFVASLAGTIADLDGQNGQIKWAATLPQPAATAPASAAKNPQLYIPADHSNVYVLSRSDGTCPEVFYLGHRPGSIAVPPVWMLGQLFVFENIGSQSAKIRILSTSSTGLELQETQTAITMEGNIVSPPQVDGRRLVVQSDAGQIKVLDVEPTAQSRRVSELVTVPKSLTQPRMSWLLADSNRVWVAQQQLMRFDVQVATLSMSRVWIKYDGDQFVAPPQRFGDVLIHARTQRGTRGVRITAANANTGEPLWETDVGVPVTYIGSAGSGYQAVNSSGMLFTLGNRPIRSQADVNPGQGKPDLLFEQAVQLSDGRAVLLNNSRSNQLAVVSPEAPKIKLLSANFGIARPTSRPTAVEDKLAVGLDRGQLVLINAASAAMVGAPYQPAVEAGQKVRWHTSVYLPESKALIAANDLANLVRLSTDGGLTELKAVRLDHPIVGPLVAVGGHVAGVAAIDSGDSLQLIDATNLQTVAAWPLSGHLIAGPFATEQGCLVQTDSKLALVSVAGQALWTIDFPASPLVAGPLVNGEQWNLATQAGQVTVLNAKDGQVLGQADVEQALSSPLSLLGTSLLMGTEEGAVLALPIPSALSEAKPPAAGSQVETSQ